MRSGNAGGDFEGGSKSVRRLVREEEEEKAEIAALVRRAEAG